MLSSSSFRGYLTVLTLLLIFGLSTVAFSRTIRVCGFGCQYGSIGKAVREASPGDLIRVQNGDYKENIRIDKELTITGTSAQWVRISPKNDARPTIQVGPSSVSVNLKSITVSASGKESGNAISVTGGAEINVTDGLIRNAGAGVEARDNSYANLMNTEIMGVKDGIRTYGSSEAVVHKGLISESGTGLIVSGSSELSLIESEISNSTRIGVHGKNTGKINVLSSTMTDNDGPGIKLTDFSRLDMEDSQVKGNGGGGILLKDSANAELIDNEITYNDQKNLAIISKECGFSGPTKSFFGEVTGTGNKIVPSNKNTICPARFMRINTQEGGGYSYPFKPSTYAFVGLIGVATMVFLVSSF